MSIYEMIYFCTIGNAEYILIGSILFGLERRSFFISIAAPVIASMIGIACSFSGTLNVYINIIWVIMLYSFFFKIRWNYIIRYSIITILLVTSADTLFISMCYVFPIENAAVLKTDPYVLGSGLAGFLIWCVVLSLVKIRRWNTAEFFKNMSLAGTILLCVGIFVIMCLFACVQGFYLEEMTEVSKRISVLFCIIVVVVMFAVFFYLGNVVMKKRYLEDIREANRNYLRAQSAYLEQTRARYEELKGFRHDIRGHIQVMELLIRDEKYDRLNEYIHRIQNEQILKATNYTDNMIVDAIIQDVFGSIMNKPDWDISIIGKYPEQTSLDDMDLCILISNALRNAKEAMEQCERKVFRMEIKQNDEEYCIIISNSIISEDIDIEKTDKKDTENHGYGINNMKKVVYRNNGQINWNIENMMMNLTIFLPK